MIAAIGRDTTAMGQILPSLRSCRTIALPSRTDIGDADLQQPKMANAEEMNLVEIIEDAIRLRHRSLKGQG